MPGSRPRIITLITSLLAALAALQPQPAGAARPDRATKIVSYDGLRLAIPAGWPAYDLNAHPATCVRFNRHAVYLGAPGRDEACPPAAAGRTEAILVSPAGAARGAGIGAGAGARLAVRRGQGRNRLTVIATWNRDPGVIRRALGVRSLRRYERAAAQLPAPAPAAYRRVEPRERHSLLLPGGGAASPGQLFTGLGFDACSAPSLDEMNAWAISPYGAAGIYIGGANMACLQPNLSAAWVSAESAAGWHLMPIYVGLQPPGNTCGCAPIVAADAAGEGVAAALDAVADAQALGLGPGNPIFFDMESYTRGGATSAAVLAFFGGWTGQLHADGYRSGIYSSSASGIADLVAETGTPFPEPDEVWIANWNGLQTTDDALVPAGDWAGERLHQYAGAATQTYGGVAISVDQDVIDAATAAAGTTAPPPAPVTTPPAASAPPAITGAPLVGQTLTVVPGTWSGSPLAYTYQWEDCNTASVCTPIAGASATTYRVAATDVGASVRIVQTATNAGGTSPPLASRGTARVVSAPTSGYWLMTAFGNVFHSTGARWFGSAVRAHLRSITGFAATPSRRGYWLVDTAGRVFAYGNAGRVAKGRYGQPIGGIVAAHRGAWLYTAAGNVFNVGGAPFDGSPKGRLPAPVVGMAATPDGRGYWLVGATGHVYSFGDAPALPTTRVRAPVRGIVAARGGGAWIYTITGQVIGLGGAPTFPSQPSSYAAATVGMARTADGGGYWLLDSGGRVHPYGDAATFAVPRHSHRLTRVAS